MKNSIYQSGSEIQKEDQLSCRSMRIKTRTENCQSDNHSILHLKDCEVKSWTSASSDKKESNKNVCLDEFD